MTDFSGKRVLITGASGFIGANLARTLIDRGASVHALVPPGSDLWRLRGCLRRISLYPANIVHARAVQDCIRKSRPEYVFHMATRRTVATAQERRATLQANVLGLLNLLEALSSTDYLGFVNAGSSMEYGPARRPHKEGDPLRPIHFYAASKTAAYILCDHFARTSGRPISTLRIFSVYGYWEAPHRLIPRAIMAALDGSVLALTRPGLRHDFVFIEDIVDACLLAAQAPAAQGEVFNIATGRETTNEQVVDLVQAITGKRLRLRVGEYPCHLSDTPHWVANVDKAARQLGWTARYDLRSGLERMVRWLCSHRESYPRLTETEAS